MNISIVVAMSQNKGIGKNNQLLWHLPSDLKRFKQITMGHPVVMGRKTFESIIVALGRPLPSRDNLVLTSVPGFLKNNDDLKNYDFTCFDSIDKLLKHLDDNYKDTEIMIIGGAEVYKQFLSIANKIYLTLVDADIDADVFFPEIDLNTWRKAGNQIDYIRDEKHKYNYSFIEYNRI